MATSDCNEQRSRVGLGEDLEPGCSPDPASPLCFSNTIRVTAWLDSPVGEHAAGSRQAPAGGSSVLLFGSGSLSRPYVAL